MVNFASTAAFLAITTNLAATIIQAEQSPAENLRLHYKQQKQRLRTLNADGFATSHHVTDTVTTCEEVIEGNPPICINVCVEVTSITKGGTLVEEKSKVKQSQCKSTNVEKAVGSTTAGSDSSKSTRNKSHQNVATSNNGWNGSAQSIAGDSGRKSNKDDVASVGGVASGKGSAFTNVHNVATSNVWSGSTQSIAGDSSSKANKDEVSSGKGSETATFNNVHTVATSHVWSGSAQSIVGTSSSKPNKSTETVVFHNVHNADTSNVWSGSAQNIVGTNSSKPNKNEVATVGGVDLSKSSKSNGVSSVVASNGWYGSGYGSAQSIVGTSNSKSDKDVVASTGGVNSGENSEIVAFNDVQNVATSNVWSGSAETMHLETVEDATWSNSWGNDGYYKDTIEDVRAHIAKLVKDSDRELIPKFLRLGFHDCIGGCDGCVDLNNMDNKGLDEPIDAIYPIVEKFKHSFSRADIWAMATLVSADLALVEGRPDGLQFPMRYVGRKDCEGANAKGVGGPEFNLPSNHVTTHELLDFFSEKFNFDAEETVIIMGVHAVATVHRNISGFGVEGEEFGWVFDAEDYVLDNRYYKMLVGDDDPVTSAPLWQGELVHNEGGIPSRYQWFHEKYGEDERPIMTSADIALVRDLSDYMHDENGVEGIVECVFKEQSVSVQQSKSYTRRKSLQNKPVCPVASETLEFMIEYKLDNELWLIDLERVLEKMLTNGYDTSE